MSRSNSNHYTLGDAVPSFTDGVGTTSTSIGKPGFNDADYLRPMPRVGLGLIVVSAVITLGCYYAIIKALIASF